MPTMPGAMEVWLYLPEDQWPCAAEPVDRCAYLRYVLDGDLAALLGRATVPEGSRGYGPISVAEVPGVARVGNTVAQMVGVDGDVGRSPSRLYVSRRASTSGLHWDGRSATLVQLHGSKTGVLFSPELTEHLDAFPDRSGPNSDVDPFAADADLPEHRVVDLEPGDVLTIPQGWWHCFRATSETSTSMSFW